MNAAGGVFAFGEVLRQQVCDELEANPTVYEPFFMISGPGSELVRERSGGTYLGFVRYMRQDGVWATELMVAATTQVIGENIDVFSSAEPNVNRYEPLRAHDLALPAEVGSMVKVACAQDFHYMSTKAWDGDFSDFEATDLPAVEWPSLEQSRKPVIKKRPAASAAGDKISVEGYDLSERRIRNNLKHKKVCSEACFAEGEKEAFWLAAGKSLPDRGRLGRILSEGTLNKHWNVLRTLVTIGVPEELRENLRVQEVVCEKPYTTAFFTHMQNNPSARGTPFQPTSVKSAKDSLCVLLEAMVVKRGEGDGLTAKQWRRKGKNRTSDLCDLAASIRDKLEGDGELGVAGPVDQEDNPLSWSELQEARDKFVRKIKKLKLKIKACNLAGKDVKYMQRKNAKQNAGLLSIDFIAQTCERIGSAFGLCFGRNLKFAKDSDEERMVWMKKGPARDLGKSCKQHRRRGKRGSMRIKKVLNAKWTKRLKKFIRKDLPVLREEAEEKGISMAVSPALREGEDAFYLFKYTDRSSFRRTAGRVCGGANTNDVKSACEYKFKDLATEQKLHPDVVQFFVGKDVDISTKHYAAFTDGRIERLTAGTAFE